MASPTRAGASSIRNMSGAWDVDQLNVWASPGGQAGEATPSWTCSPTRPGPRLMKLAVPRMPGSATSQEHLHSPGLDAEASPARRLR